MKLPLKNLQGKEVGSLNVRDDVFGVPMHSAVVHQVIVAQLANARQGTSQTKTRSEVSGGGAKPRPQKYTGRARQGSIRSPQWKGGGVVFGPRPRSYRQRTPKRVKRQALVATLSDKARDNSLVVIESLTFESAKTKRMVEILEALNANPPVLLVTDKTDLSVIRSSRNIPRLKMLPVSLINPLVLLNHKTVILTVDAVKKAEELWGGRFVRRVGQIPTEIVES